MTNNANAYVVIDICGFAKTPFTMDLNELEKRVGDIVERQMRKVLVSWQPDDVWVSSRIELEKELGWGRSIVEQIFNDPDLQPAIVTYGERKVNVNVSLLRRLIQQKNK